MSRPADRVGRADGDRRPADGLPSERGPTDRGAVPDGRRRGRVVVVGGGVSGLVAARRLRDAGHDVTVVEQSSRLGGKLRTIKVGGERFDAGAEAFLVRRPEATTLAAELGVDLVHPARVGAGVRVEGRTAPLPPRTLLGVPVHPDGLDRVLTADGLARVAAETDRAGLAWEPGADVPVGRLVRDRLGPEVADRLLDPLLGGVYAGRADELGLRPTIPAIADALDTLAAAGGPVSLRAAALAAWRPGEPSSPVFGAPPGGMSVLVDALAAGLDVRLGLPVRALVRAAAGWRLEIGPAPAPELLDADAVVLAVPPPALRRLLTPLSPLAATAAAGIDVASSAIVALALPGGTELPRASGVLVAAGEPLLAKAFTWSAVKWPHLGARAGADGVTLLRASVGRHGDPHELQVDDDELVRRVRADLATVTGVTSAPVDAVVTRWGGGLPQYAVGHTDRVAAIERGVAELPGLAVAGAALHGIGIPACVATATAAADRVAAHLARA